MKKQLTREFFVESGRKGGQKSGENKKKTRLELINQVASQVDKETLDLVQSKFSNEEIIRLLKAWEKPKK